jgi:hypothetical protein
LEPLNNSPRLICSNHKVLPTGKQKYPHLYPCPLAAGTNK